MDLFTLSASLGLDITNFESGITTAQRLLLQFAGAVVDFGKDVIKTGMGFDKQMSAVQAVMGLTEKTAENLATMNGLREFALEQARDSIFTAEETATAYYYMGMAGWRAEQMVAGLPGVMALAAASGEDLKMTSDMVTDSLTAFGLGAGQAAHFADVLAVTATNANTDVARMKQTFKNLAPIAGALGYSIEDVALSVGLIADSGIKGAQAGTALRNIFTRIATNAGATTKTLGALQVVTDELGVSFYTAEGRARPWGEVLMEIRTAWNGLDPDKVDKVTAAFGEFFASSQSAGDTMTEFAGDLDAWTTEWNNLVTTVEREQFVSQLEPQFAALGISMRDSNGQLREFSEVADDARVKLGGLTDQEQIYYGKQIGSLRGISGWLALMTASEDDVKQLTEAIKNADGAAKAMADTRLDNLWGDVVKLSAAFDVLKIAIFDNINGPMREIVQEATTSIDNIRDAIEKDGLTGGIEQVGVEIERLSDKFQPVLESLGKALVPVITSLVTTLAESTEPFVQLGMSFGGGILQGIEQALATTENPMFKALARLLGIQDNSGGLLGDLYSGLIMPKEQALEINETSPVTVPIQPEVTDGAAGIWAAISDAASSGLNTVEIDGSMMTLKDAAALAESIEQGASGAGAAIASNIGTDLSGIDTSGMESKIGSAGIAAGSKVASAIKNALSLTSFDINVKANVSGLPTEHNARAMNVGRIFRSPTIFGAAQGALQMAGDAGPEAVVGTNSLTRMIRDAVAYGMRSYAASAPSAPVSAQPIVLQINGKTLGRVMAGDNAAAAAGYNKSIAMGYGG